MTSDEICGEYKKNGRISGKAMTALRALLRESHDPYSVITLAGDVAAFQVADDIAVHLGAKDAMVRWNAAGVLFTRFRDARLAQLCVQLLDRETDTLVRSIGLVGAGELLPLVEDPQLRKELVARLWRVLEAEDEFPEIRGSAYVGIEAAVGLPPLERAPANRLLDPRTDFKQVILDEFRRIYAG